MFLPVDVQTAITRELESFGDRVLSAEVLGWVADAERNLPQLKTWDTFGRRVDELITSEGWRNLQKLGIQEGIVAIGHTRQYAQFSRLHQFFKFHLWSASCAVVTCPSAMQDGAGALLSRYLLPDMKTPEATQQVAASALSRLMSRDPESAWTSGQWMTERPGGSDVRNTETWATFAPDLPSNMPMEASDGSPLGPWQINGFKWFSSATDANMTVLLAKTGSSDQVSAFFAPTRVRSTISTSSKDPELRYNGIQIQRLKNKMGTKPLPTAELVLSGMRAHLLGEEGKGTKVISAILNITRIYNAVSSVGGWGRGLAISRAFSRVRKAGGKLLMDIPAHVRGLAEQHVLYRANMLFTYFAVALLGVIENDIFSSKKKIAGTHSLAVSAAQASCLLRLLTPVLKARTALASIAGLRFCMESLGGIGYLENEDPQLNIARLFRDSNVFAIWEGTTDVMASDTVRVLKGREGRDAIQALDQWLREGLQRMPKEAREVVEHRWSALKDSICSTQIEELLYRGRDVMASLEWIVSSVLLNEDAIRDNDRLAMEILARWIGTHDIEAMRALSSCRNWRESVALDQDIVFGGTEFSSSVESKL